MKWTFCLWEQFQWERKTLLVDAFIKLNSVDVVWLFGKGFLHPKKCFMLWGILIIWENQTWGRLAVEMWEYNLYACLKDTDSKIIES